MVLVALGSNIPSVWGSPSATLSRALEELANYGLIVEKASQLYRTIPQGDKSQPAFANAVAQLTTSLPATALLRVLKRVEANAGRKPSYRWAPRPLDLDIVDYKHLICNWKVNASGGAGGVVLPHPRAHLRAFVLRPIMDVAPFWHHPIFGLTAPELLKNPEARKTGAILAVEEFPHKKAR